MLDLGCGTGFHLPRFAATAAAVVGVKPHPACWRWPGAARALTTVAWSAGTAQALPLPDASVDVVHARWAYFFGPGCEPGLAELDRVVRRGGAALRHRQRRLALDVRRLVPPRLPPPATTRRRSSGSGSPGLDPDAGRHGLAVRTRADLEAVVRIEFMPAAAEEILRHHAALEVDYAVNLWSRGSEQL